MEALRSAHNDSVKAGKPTGKVSNPGSVTVSALEIAQKFKHNSDTYARENLGANIKLSINMADAAISPHPSLVQGVNITGFLKVANAMKVHGDW
ncbi:glutamate dehydrogenase [Neocallimastix lanati (nom. inval.)]|nr:glutamate dehydrogenase [Neocallimastix sp. JGI-2020a]